MTKFQRLAKRLTLLFGREPTNFVRTYAGKYMKSGGAFLWEAKVGHETIGSIYPVTELLKSKKLIVQRSNFNDIEVVPEEDTIVR